MKYFKMGVQFVLGIVVGIIFLAFFLGIGAASAKALFEIIKPYL